MAHVVRFAYVGLIRKTNTSFSFTLRMEKFASRYFSTPKKMGAQTAEANINAGIAAAKQIVDFLKNGNETFRVNK